MDPAEILVVDDDEGTFYETFILSSLDELSAEYYYWDMTENGSLNGNELLFDVCIWFTGNDSMNTLTTDDKTGLIGYLEQGNTLILSGQNIGEDLGPDDPFMNDYLKASHETDDINQYLLDGIEGDPVSDGTTLFLIGSGGASNQTSPSTCTTLPGGEVFYRYQNTPNPAGAVRYTDGVYGYNTFYFSFGIEAISGMMNSITRAQLFANIFQSIGFNGISGDVVENTPNKFELYPAFPNPFNPSTRISYYLPETGNIKISIYDVLGRKTAELFSGTMIQGFHNIEWNGSANNGSPVSSGIYYFRFMYGDNVQSQPLIYLK